MYNGLISGLTWAIDTVILSLVLLGVTGEGRVALLGPLVSTFLHDLFSAFWINSYMGVRGKFKATLTALKTRGGRFIMLGALLGGPVGMSAYIMSISLIGPSLAAIISSLYPAMGALLAYIFLKEKRKVYQIISLLVSIGGVIVLGYSSEGTISNLWLGILAGLVCVMAWASEAVICTYGLQHENISDEVGLHIRQTVSMLTYGIFIITLFNAWDITLGLFKTQSVWLALLAAFFGTVSYLFYYRSFARIGASKTMALNISYSGFAVIVSYVVLHTVPTWDKILLGIVIVAGGIISAYDK